MTFRPNKKQKFDRWSTQREQVGFHSDGWQYNRYLLVWRTSNGSNSRWPEERSHSIQSWLLFWKNNRGRDTPFLMSISGLLNCACMLVIPAGTLSHILHASAVILIYAIDRVCAPNKHTNPKSWPWPNASLTQDTFKMDHHDCKGFFSIWCCHCWFWNWNWNGIEIHFIIRKGKFVLDSMCIYIGNTVHWIHKQ